MGDRNRLQIRPGDKETLIHVVHHNPKTLHGHSKGEYTWMYPRPTRNVEHSHHKKSPELLKAWLQGRPPFTASGRYLVLSAGTCWALKRTPFLVVFFATPDVPSGLSTVANYDLATPEGVIVPMGSGCGCSSVVAYPLEETNGQQRCCASFPVAFPGKLKGERYMDDPAVPRSAE